MPAGSPIEGLNGEYQVGLTVEKSWSGDQCAGVEMGEGLWVIVQNRKSNGL